MDPELFPALPEDLSSLSDEQLGEILETATATAKAIAAREGDVLEKIGETPLVEAMTKAVEIVESTRTEQAARAEHAAAEDAALLELASKIDPPAAEEEVSDEDAPEAEATDEESTEEVSPEDAEAVDELAEVVAIVADEAPEAAPVAIAASADADVITVTTKEERVTRNSRPPRPAAAFVPKKAKAQASAVLTASAESGLKEGEINLQDISQAMIRQRERFGHIPEGANERITIASITASYPEDRVLNGDDQEKIGGALGGPPGSQMQVRALTASGGLCAPVQPYYDLQTLAMADRPVRDALVGFNATRGGIRYAPPSSLASITTGGGSNAAIGIRTMTQDTNNSPTKTCQHIGCPSFVEVDVQSIYHCLTFGNIGARAWPEQVANFTQLAMAAWARTAETALLDGIEAASTKLTAAQAGGANATLYAQIIQAGAAMRNRHRMNPDTKLRLMMPAWAKDLLLADASRTQFDRYPDADAGIEARLSAYGVAVTWFWDGSSGAGNVFGAQSSATALNGFPSTVDWYLFPEGSYLFVDSGQLELGIVRDSTLNSTNDYQVFGESWENIAFIGVESLRVRSTVCDTGATGAAVNLTCGSS